MTTAAMPAPSGLDERVRRKPFLAVLFSGFPTIVGAALVGIAAFFAIFAPLIAPHDPNLQNLGGAFKPPAWLAGGSPANLLGTDDLGRDIFSRIVWGARVAAIVGLSGVAIGGSLGVALGIIAGYFGGIVDDVIARIADVQFAFPSVLLAIAVVGVIGPSLTTVIVTIGITGWVQYVRVVRAEALSLRERDFVQAAVATGASLTRVLLWHVLPSIGSSITVLATFGVARAIILESALSFLALGVPQEITSWGAMLADGRQFLDTAWWLGLFPGLAIFLTVLGVNLFGDGLRDALDPHSR
ncbi:MAG: ABC transporter permease [Candidatus Eremiobacteraeota bacterium]|nr:ABC transporter permease [Candidatus Eremiobacteraeota bacterium]